MKRRGVIILFGGLVILSEIGRVSFGASERDCIVGATPDCSVAERATAYYHRGVAYFRTGDNARVLSDYDEAIRLAPKLAPAYTNRGLAYRLTPRSLPETDDTIVALHRDDLGVMLQGAAAEELEGGHRMARDWIVSHPGQSVKISAGDRGP